MCTFLTRYFYASIPFDSPEQDLHQAVQQFAMEFYAGEMLSQLYQDEPFIEKVKIDTRGSIMNTMYIYSFHPIIATLLQNNSYIPLSCSHIDEISLHLNRDGDVGPYDDDGEPE